MIWLAQPHSTGLESWGRIQEQEAVQPKDNDPDPGVIPEEDEHNGSALE